jgi:uncharacterized protein YbbK (DUF523 family)
MDDAAMVRFHARIDSMLSELSGLSQRVARIEVQESRVTDNAKDIDRLEERCEKLIGRLSKVDVSIAHLQNASPASAKSKVADYAGKGGLVVSGGAVVELIRWLVESLKN